MTNSNRVCTIHAPSDPQLSSDTRRKISAYFELEADARRTAEMLDVMFEQCMTVTSRPVNGRRWLLTFVLPEDPGLSTFYVDASLLAMVLEHIEGNGGALWDSTVDASDATGYDDTSLEASDEH